MPSFLDLWTERSASDLKAQLVALCQANALPVTAWLLGRPSERWLDITPRLIYAVLYGAVRPAARAFFLDFLTDPGDDGDKSADQTPRPGFLSAMGEGWYGTTRRGQTYATTTVTITNTGSGSSVAFGAFDLTFTTTDAPKADGGRPTYRNETGSAILAPNASISFSVSAEQIGIYGNASALSLVLITHSFDGAGALTVTSSGGPLGEAREAADLYRARCRLAAAKLSPGGPGAAYRYAANTARDGTPLQKHDGTGVVGITKTYASADNATGVVLAYYADDDGPAATVDVASANANISGVPLGSIVDPLGVAPDGVTFTGAAATPTPINIVGTAKIKRVPGMTDGALQAAAVAAIGNTPGAPTPNAMTEYFRLLDIGGRDQTSGAGIVPTSDFLGVVYGAYPGLHAVVIATPGASTTAIALGHVATLGSCAITVTVVA